MLRRIVIIVLCILGIATTYAVAEKPNMSPEQLRATATHVVVGKVLGVYERKVDKDDWSHTYYIAEVQVSKTEKGQGLKEGDLAYARYWRRTWKGKGDPPADTSGHRQVPNEGDTLRIYLARNAYDGFNSDNNDGGFNVIGANGFENLESP